MKACRSGTWSPPYLETGTAAEWYRGWKNLTEDERDAYRARSRRSQSARKLADAGLGPSPIHPINVPRLDPKDLMPEIASHWLRALSLFSGGGGLDLGFERAGFTHIASYEVLPFAAETLRCNRPDWEVNSGTDGDVTLVDWTRYRGRVDVVHGGPPCQPFSVAGRQNGNADVRDMFPEFVRCVLEIRPRAFVAENVPALAGQKFSGYVRERIEQPLRPLYTIFTFVLNAPSFGVPQVRRRLFFVGVRDHRAIQAFRPPRPTHDWSHFRTDGEADSMDMLPHYRLPRTAGVREALGLPPIGRDSLAPTIRSTLSGPRHTTSIVNSTAAVRTWASLEIWPHGVARDRESASRFVTENKHFRLSVPDCKILQGFPGEWEFSGPVYKALGQLGNSVCPPVAYNVARAVYEALMTSS